MNKSFTLLLLACIALLAALSACSDSDGCSSSGVVKSPSVVRDSFVDVRDGQVYRTVKIGNQVWMAENLNYKTPNSFCFVDADSNCTKYGRLYTWEATENVCPAGFHLPTVDEWEKLIMAAGGNEVAYHALKSKRGTGGANCEYVSTRICMEDGGWDKYGFGALPAGERLLSNNNTRSFFYYTGEGWKTSFWSSTDKDKDDAYSMTFQQKYFKPRVEIQGMSKNSGFSIRCVKN